MTDLSPPPGAPAPGSRPTAVIGLVVFALALGVYLRTLTPTVPFWDSGEFIAVSNILGIPHPPGTPFYVILGRLFAMLPLGAISIAQKVNGLSALASALAVLLTYLTTLRLIRIAQGRGPGLRPAPPAAPAAKGAPAPPEPAAPAAGEGAARSEWLAQVGAVTGALLLAFSDNFWGNSVEAEVYSMMSLAQILVLWLGLRWWEAHEKRPTVGPLLVAIYVMWLSIGLHLGVGMMGVPLMILVLLVDWRVAMLLAMPCLTMLGVTFGLERMAGVMLILSYVTFIGFAFQRKLNGWVTAAGAVAAAWCAFGYSFSDKDYNLLAGAAATLAMVVPTVWLAARHREGRILVLALLLMGAGYSTHLYLPIRAAQHPAINEGNPSTWPALKDLLERKQYGHTSMFVRRGKIESQIGKEFWRYLNRQWPLVQPLTVQGSVVTRPEPRLWAVMLPLLLALLGALWQARRERVPLAAVHTLTMLLCMVVTLPYDYAPLGIPRGLPLLFLALALLPVCFAGGRRGWGEFQAMLGTQGRGVSFLTMASFAAFASVGMILFLNFSDKEVRDRDYFFTSLFHVLSMWMGLGVVGLTAWFQESFGPGALRRTFTAAFAGLLALQPVALLWQLWYLHDRSRNYVAHDYAWNMLAPLKPDSYVFTNGDNDTFPLWYMQEVENFRRDVKVVNLSLLNTDWYIFQLRDRQPKLPVDLPDHIIRAMGGGLIQQADGSVIQTNDYMVRHMIENSRLPNGGWTKQPYFAVTVPDHSGYDKDFSLEGLVYRVNPDSTQGQVDEPATIENLYHRFKYRGLFNPDGSWDRSVYKDENAATLSRNYAAAHVQLAYLYRNRGQLDRAITELERARRMFPDYIELGAQLGSFYMAKGDTVRALALFEDVVRQSPNMPEAHYFYGMALVSKHDLEGGLREFETAIRLAPDYSEPYYGAYYFCNQAGQRERGVGYIERLARANPNDAQAQQMLQMLRPQATPGGALPPPLPSNLP